MTQIKNRTLPEEQPAGRQPRGEDSLGSWSTFSNSCVWWGLGNETSSGLVSELDQTLPVGNTRHLQEQRAEECSQEEQLPALQGRAALTAALGSLHPQEQLTHQQHEPGRKKHH